MTTIGFVGLGAMGGRLAGRLLAAGHEVHGNNRTAAKAAGLVDRGLRWHDTPREKDIRLALEAGDALGVPEPAARATDQALAEAREHGYGGRDIAAFFRVLGEMGTGTAAAGSAGRAEGGHR